MQVEMDELLGRVSAGENITMDEMASAVGSIMRGEWSESQIGVLLMALRSKGETPEEIAGAAAAIRQQMTRIRSPWTNFVDTCGTGGDGLQTFNISTAAAIVTAGAGVPVAKHGNRAITSKSGSADVLERLGVNVDATVKQVEACLDRVQICFCFAPLLHQSMKQVGPVRKKLGVPTIFNLLGPLCNPAHAPFQVIGVGRDALRPRLAQAVAMLGSQRCLLVHGADGLDEISLSGPTAVTIVHRGEISEEEWTPADFGVSTAPIASLQVDGPESSCAVITRVLSGERGPARDAVVLNSAAALWAVNPNRPLSDCAAAAQQSIDTGKARETLAALVRVSHAAA
ncbi:MAG: anthranilate phosphoribosyltransferase [Planctomycetota bacterium]|nr:anthranilate phosphoribosyltransferase [Planctomycetota bacterium]MDA1178715.1 anthranilate phosphoribosyltransferase [Planctomycetota bacterium]